MFKIKKKQWRPENVKAHSKGIQRRETYSTEFIYDLVRSSSRGGKEGQVYKTGQDEEKGSRNWGK